MEKESAAKVLELLSQANPEVQSRVQKIKESIDKLPEVPAYKETLGGFEEGDFFEGEGVGDVKFKAVLMVVGGKSKSVRLLRVDIFGEPRMRAKTVIDFLFALHRGPDARAEAHDDIDDRFQDQLYWKMS